MRLSKSAFDDSLAGSITGFESFPKVILAYSISDTECWEGADSAGGNFLGWSSEAFQRLVILLSFNSIVLSCSRLSVSLSLYTRKAKVKSARKLRRNEAWQSS